MEWKNYPDQKPKTDHVCLVQTKEWSTLRIATYQKNQDVFVLYEPGRYDQLLLKIDYYIEIPEWPMETYAVDS